jgi:hypothetical protein
MPVGDVYSQYRPIRLTVPSMDLVLLSFDITFCVASEKVLLWPRYPNRWSSSPFWWVPPLAITIGRETETEETRFSPAKSTNKTNLRE